MSHVLGTWVVMATGRYLGRSSKSPSRLAEKNLRGSQERGRRSRYVVRDEIDSDRSQKGAKGKE